MDFQLTSGKMVESGRQLLIYHLPATFDEVELAELMNATSAFTINE